MKARLAMAVAAMLAATQARAAEIAERVSPSSLPGNYAFVMEVGAVESDQGAGQRSSSLSSEIRPLSQSLQPPTVGPRIIGPPGLSVCHCD
jgi:hypothetical protein